jgi:hypothetical protein
VLLQALPASSQQQQRVECHPATFASAVFHLHCVYEQPRFMAVR